MTPKQKLPPKVQIILAALLPVLIGIVGYLTLVSPQHAKAAKLAKEIDSTNAKITEARALSASSRRVQPIRVAELFRLVKAMPDQSDMTGILLQLNQIAADSGIVFESIRPGNSVVVNGYQVVPIAVRFQGNFYNLSDFLLRLRNLVAIHHGRLDTSGRLFTVDDLAFSGAQTGFPQLEAQLDIDAFVYGTNAPATSGAPAQPGGSTTTTTNGATPTPGTTTSLPTTTTPAPAATTPTPTTPPGGATAAGAAP